MTTRRKTRETAVPSPARFRFQSNFRFVSRFLSLPFTSGAFCGAAAGSCVRRRRPHRSPGEGLGHPGVLPAEMPRGWATAALPSWGTPMPPAAAGWGLPVGAAGRAGPGLAPRPPALGRAGRRGRRPPFRPPRPGLGLPAPQCGLGVPTCHSFLFWGVSISSPHCPYRHPGPLGRRGLRLLF